MAYNRVRTCRGCGITSEDVHISARGSCAECGDARLREAIRQIQVKKGPFYDKWLRQHRAALARQLASKS